MLVTRRAVTLRALHARLTSASTMGVSRVTSNAIVTRAMSDGKEIKAQLKQPSYMLPHVIWTKQDIEGVEITHKPPEKLVDWLAYWTIKLVRSGFDFVTGYNSGKPPTAAQWVTRIVFLETVAGVPGMMGAMVRHLQSLRRMGRDHGWIHTLLEDAENERMHLLTILELRQPGAFMRLMVLLVQGVFSNVFFMAYVLSPRYCHRVVGYLEEEAVKTYTRLLGEMQPGKSMEIWTKTPAPEIAINYWSLGPDATMKDVIGAFRADEAHHRLVNHTLAGLRADDPNPFIVGERSAADVA